MPLLVVLGVVQSTLFTHLFNLGGVAPNLVLVSVVAWNLLRGTREGFVWAFVGGLALDLLSAGPLGLSSVALLLVCAVAGLTEGHVQPQSLVLALVTTASGTLVYAIVVLIGVALGGQPLESFAVIAGRTLSAMLLNTIAMLPIHWLLRRLYLAAERSEVRLGA